MKNRSRNWITWLLMVCIVFGCAGGGLADDQVPAVSAPTPSAADFDALLPLMDLLASAAMGTTSEEHPFQSVPGAEGTLDSEFINAFFVLGVYASPSLGITKAMLADTAQQAQYLGAVFSAQVPELRPLTDKTPFNGHIGFLPVNVNTAAETGGIQIMGEIYWAPRPLGELTDYAEVQWLDERAIYTFQEDSAAMNGFLLSGFSTGTDLSMEDAMQGYFQAIAVEYFNAQLGFSVQYPSVFTDDILVEDATGVSASLPDGSASFFAKRIVNANNADLNTYISGIAGGIPGAQFDIREDFQSATLTYTTAEGKIVFDVYIVTDNYIYQAQLSYPGTQDSKFHMFKTYMENSFMATDAIVG